MQSNPYIFKIKSILSSNKASIAITIFTIVIRSLQLIFFFNIRSDRSYQVAATNNFIKGFGITNAFAYSNDISKTIYEPIFQWPPGYTLILSPFHILFNNNYIIAGITVDILFAAILIIYTRKILILLQIEKNTINAFTLFHCFFIYFFYFIASSDSITISIFTVALYYVFKLLFDQTNYISNSFYITSLLFLCALMKYLYQPLIFILPLYIFFKGYFNHNNELKKSGFYSVIFLFLALGFLFIYQKNISGTVAYISQPTRGFFPENLKTAYPFIPSAIIKPDTASLFFQYSITNNIFFTFFQLVHFLIFVLAIVFCLKSLKKYAYIKFNRILDLIILCVLLSLSLTLLLGILSLLVAKENWGNGVYWTYIEEPRYYGIIILLIHILIFTFYSFSLRLKTKAIRWTFIIIIACMIPETIRGIVFTLNRIANLGREEYSWQQEDRFQKFSKKVIQNALLKKNAQSIVVGGSSDYYNRRVSIYNDIPTLKDLGSSKKINSTNTTLLLLIFNKNEIPNYLSLIPELEREPNGILGGFNFYTIYVSPN